MIRIGLNQNQKQKEVNGYIESHDIKKVYCFYFKKFKPSYNVSCEIEYIEYADIEKYKFFYRLLEEIDNSSLIIMDGCMRTQNRSELIYNCAHHYLNQTEHRIVFEFLPIIDNKDDFMILLDFENKGKYKGKAFDYIYLQTEDVKIKSHKIKMEVINVPIASKDEEEYSKKKEELFNKLGSKDPDTIPRNLQLFAGNLKKSCIEPDKQYAARNKRFKFDNVYSYNDITKKGEYIVVDTHYRRLNMNDFIKTTGMNKLKYLCTPLPIDCFIVDEFTKWKARLDAIYAKANLYK